MLIPTKSKQNPTASLIPEYTLAHVQCSVVDTFHCMQLTQLPAHAIQPFSIFLRGGSPRR
jgi:hypothetical protein